MENVEICALSEGILKAPQLIAPSSSVPPYTPVHLALRDTNQLTARCEHTPWLCPPWLSQKPAPA